MLGSRPLRVVLAASDIQRAKDFYGDKLDLKPVEELEDGNAYYETGGARFLLYNSTFAGTNQATAASWEGGRHRVRRG